MRLIRLSLCATTQTPRQLTPADLSELETEFTKLKVHGGRMNEMQMKLDYHG